MFRQRRTLPSAALVPVLVLGLVTTAGTAPAAAETPAPNASTTPIETSRATTPLAPGVTLDSFDRWEPGGWVRADAVTVDLTSGATVDYISADTVSQVEPISSQIADRPETVAAINGDFFDMNDTNAPHGIGVADGELVKSHNPGWDNAIGFDAAGLGRIMQVGFDGTVTFPDGGTRPLGVLNTDVIGTDGIGAYTSLWGAMSRTRLVDDASRVTEVTLVDGVVTAVSATPGEGAIPAGTVVLVGREAGADALAALAAGDRVGVEYAANASDGGELDTAIGARQMLVVNGEVQPNADDGVAARSAVGFSADGATMYLLAVEGRQVNGPGITVPQLSRMMLEMGAYNAINIDGGGSSTLMARKAGEEGSALVNSPSDGSERPVANGLAVSVPAGSGTVKGFSVATAADPVDAPGSTSVADARPDRVFPGLTRPLTATGYDETYGPVAGEKPRWDTDPGRVGTVDRDGVFHAKRSGTTTVTAKQGRATGSLDLSVLGPLSRVDGTVDRVALPGASATGTFGVLGYDEAGYGAPIDPGDVTLEYDESLLTITPRADGNFDVAANAESGAALVTVTVGGHSTTVPVTVGLTEVSVAPFDDAAQWTFSSSRSTGAIAAAEGHTGTGVELTYDFAQSTATRAAYANPPAYIPVEGQPQAFGMWINSAGNGEWPSLHLVDANGTSVVLRSDHLTWTGWRYAEFPVPAGVAYPVQVRRFYVAETGPTKQYQGRIVIDDLVAKVPVELEAPEEPVVADPLVTTTVDGREWRFAVMSDSQFVARDPDSDIVASARRTLREIKAAEPDFLIINGDFVDEASEADLDFARQILTEELGDDLPWYYVPGNHEVMGGGIERFTAEFGAPQQVFDHKGTRFITLDTSRLTVRGGGFEQIAMLRTALDEAAADRTINSVVVVEHVPPRDPMPQKASQLGDRKEAATIEQWLTDFGLSTGKGTALIGAHVGTFHASHVDGVPYLINGNSGKAPATPADEGGFVGWTEFGVDPVSRGEQRDRRENPYAAGPSDWLAAQIRPQLDALAVSAPASLTVGDAAQVTATLTQQGDRVVPVAYPVSAQWTGSPGLCIVDSDGDWDRRYRCVALFDPATGTLTAVRRGEVTLTVTVNGVSQAATVTLTR